MRTGKIGLKAYLYRIKRADTPECDCGWANETIGHLIEDCPLYKSQRKLIFGRRVVRDAPRILLEPGSAVKAVAFMLYIGVLDQFSHLRKKLNSAQAED